MRTVSARIVGGKVVTRAKLPDGAKVTLFVHDTAEHTLDDEEAAGITQGIEDGVAGRVVPAKKLLAYLRRR